MSLPADNASPSVWPRALSAAIVALAISVAPPAFASGGASQTRTGPESAHPALTTAALAVADRFGADAGERILRQGGNAVDAAVAIAFTLAVTYPEAGNIGGGGFMTLYHRGKPYFLDFRERAPLAATKDMFLDGSGNVIPEMSGIGHRAAGVPGTVAGLWEAHQRFGGLKWKQLLAPAIEYAQDGFEAGEQSERRRDRAAAYFAGRTNFGLYFGHLKHGVRFRQPELAQTLKRISERGAKDFYEGRTADFIIEEMRGGDGLITRRDLNQYRAVWRQPIVANWNGYRVITAPPPSSGGIGLIQLLKMKADLKDQFTGVELNTPQYIHLVAEIEKRVFADRAQYLGDPDFDPVPVAQLIDDGYLAKRAAEVDPSTPSAIEKVRPGIGMAGHLPAPGTAAEKTGEKVQTTHFSVVDQWGNAVAFTYTINGYFGSGVVVAGAGFLLNDEMDDFSVKAGVENRFGLSTGDANSIAPAKRPLSSMAPTLLSRDGKLALVIGTPGGTRIFTSIFQVLNNVYEFRLPLKEAVAQMRFHHQLFPPNTLFWEPYNPIDGDLAKQLESRGYGLKVQGFNGDIQAVKIDGKVPEPVSDPRGRGVARVVRSQ